MLFSAWGIVLYESMMDGVSWLGIPGGIKKAGFLVGPGGYHAALWLTSQFMTTILLFCLLHSYCSTRPPTYSTTITSYDSAQFLHLGAIQHKTSRCDLGRPDILEYISALSLMNESPQNHAHQLQGSQPYPRGTSSRMERSSGGVVHEYDPGHNNSLHPHLFTPKTADPGHS